MVFIRRIEDFVCDHCGTRNRGDGYTNHCRACLYSRHVDVEPGDRASDCGGLMVPVGVEQKSGTLVLVHRCTRCRVVRRCRTSPQDDMERIREVSANQPPPWSVPPTPRPRTPRRRPR